MIRLTIIMLIMLIMLASCSPYYIKSGYTKQDYIQSPNELCNPTIKENAIPENAKEVGRLKVRDSGVSIKCSERVVLEELKKEACKLNANLIVLQNVMESSIHSTCFQTDAIFLTYDTGMVSSDSKDSSLEVIGVTDSISKTPITIATLYADSLINSGFYNCYLKNSEIENGSGIRVISNQELKLKLDNTRIKKLNITYQSGSRTSCTSFSLTRNEIECGKGRHILLNEIQVIELQEKGSFANSMKSGFGTLFGSMLIFAGLESLDYISGGDFDLIPVFALPITFSISGFIAGATNGEKETIYFDLYSRKNE